MDPLSLKGQPIGRQIEILSTRRDLLQRLWPEEKRISMLVREAVGNALEYAPRDPRHLTALNFLENVFYLLRRPCDVVELCEALPKPQQRLWFLDRLVMSNAVEGDLIAELVSDVAVFLKLPQKGGWVGHAIVRRVRILFEDSPDSQFEIEELIPLGIDADRVTARAMLGAAFDENRLTPASEDRLLELFAGDRYLAEVIEQRRKRGSSEAPP